MTTDRIATLEDTYKQDPAWNRPNDAAIESRFERVKAKLLGYLSEPARTLQVYPETMTGVPARYARTYAWHKDARLDKSLAEVDALLAAAPNDPYFLELKGQVLLESGRPVESLAPLRRATELSGFHPLIATAFGHALIATEDPAHLAEAEQVLKTAVSLDRENPFAWYQLGVIYGMKGDIPRAQLASAEQQSLQWNFPMALRSAEMAQASLPKGSPDWLRAGDIAMQSRAMIEQQKKRR
jgi:predicted Zn-dependent protease